MGTLEVRAARPKASDFNRFLAQPAENRAPIFRHISSPLATLTAPDRAQCRLPPRYRRWIMALSCRLPRWHRAASGKWVPA